MHALYFITFLTLSPSTHHWVQFGAMYPDGNRFPSQQACEAYVDKAFGGPRPDQNTVLFCSNNGGRS